MNFNPIHVGGEPSGPFEASAPPADKVIEGNPAFRIWPGKSAGERLICGIWEATPGAWRSEKGRNWEFFTVISGVSEFIEEGKPPVRLEAGGTFAMQPGCIGIWRVIETTRKSFVIHQG